jgi:hypothetical protein
MRSLVASIMFILCFSASEARAQLQVYGFGGGGGISPNNVYTYWSGSTVTGGGGAEYVTRSGLAFSAELEAIRRKTYFNDSRTSAVASIDAGYHFKTGGERKLVPFVSGGYSSIRGINVGGGFNYWLSPRLAIRAEARNHTLLGSDTALNVYEFRLGVTLRPLR